MKCLTCASTEETQALGENLGRILALYLTQELARDGADLFSIALTGDLGTGKTTLIQGLARGLGVDAGYYITSPTFNIINEYPAGDLRLCHLDLYRLAEAEELDYLGFEDLLDSGTVLAVEWPDLLEATGFAFDLSLDLTFDADFNRKISLIPSGQAGKKVLSKLFS